jgi:hypothetical protein
MFANVRGVWGFLGVGLALVALYLVLAYGTQTTNVIKAGGGALSDFYKTLQGR